MYIQEINYQRNSLSLFNHLAHMPYAMLLDSCHDQGVNERFDIMVAAPAWVLTSTQQSIKLQIDNKTTILTQPLFTALKLQLAQQPNFTLAAIPEHLPFATGIVGYVAYDSGYALNKVTCTTLCDIQLPTAVLCYYDWCVVLDHQLQQCFLISQQAPPSSRFNAIQQWLNQPIPQHEAFSLQAAFQSNLTQNQYLRAFEQIQQHIHAGDCYQVNFSQRFHSQYTGSPWLAYQDLRQKSPAPMAAFINLPAGAILSLSPERFLHVDRDKVTTKPIKGTRPRYADPAMDQHSAAELLASTKDHAENVMIVDLLRNDLSKSCTPASVITPELCALESFSNVHHLVSTVKGLLATDQHPLDLFKNCFPGGSITGAPKRRTMQIIDALEPNHRGIYCGSIVYCDIRNKMDSNIAIRTLQCDQSNIYCHGGGGIVSDSQPEAEYQESLMKIANLISGKTVA